MFVKVKRKSKNDWFFSKMLLFDIIVRIVMVGLFR